MRKDDARKLDHKTLEAMREGAVRRVQEGESPEVVARILVWGGPPCTDGWRNTGVVVGAP
jgi:hypothetical protein